MASREQRPEPAPPGVRPPESSGPASLPPCVAAVPLLCYVQPVSTTLTIRLGDRLAQALEKEAKQSGLPKGQIARRALEALLQEQGRLRVMSQYFGTCGGPADLSTNKAYRRAWTRRRA